MNCIRTIVICALIAMFAGQPAYVLAEPIPDPPTPSDNAAVWYMTAQYFLSSEMDRQAQDVFDKYRNLEPAEAAEAAETINQFQTTLGFIRAGAVLDNCSWAVDLKGEGVGALLPHLTILRQFAKLLSVSTQARLDAGDAEGALADALAIIRMSRHAANDGTLVGCLVQLSIEKMAIETLSDHLHRFDRAQLKVLRDGLAGVPKPRSMRHAIAGERQVGVWIKEQFTGQGDPSKSPLFDAFDAAQLREAFQGKEPNEVAALLTKWFDEMDAYYQRLYDNFALPYDEFVKADKQFAQNVQESDNLFVVLMMPALGSAYEAERRSHSLRAMLDAAIAYRLGGEQAFDKAPDPADDKPFGSSVTDDGFVLSSRLKKRDGQVLSLMFDKELSTPLD